MTDAEAQLVLLLEQLLEIGCSCEYTLVLM